jgi:hypothetical protein
MSALDPDPDPAPQPSQSPTTLVGNPGACPVAAAATRRQPHPTPRPAPYVGAAISSRLLVAPCRPPPASPRPAPPLGVRMMLPLTGARLSATSPSPTSTPPSSPRSMLHPHCLALHSCGFPLTRASPLATCFGCATQLTTSLTSLRQLFQRLRWRRPSSALRLPAIVVFPSGSSPSLATALSSLPISNSASPASVLPSALCSRPAPSLVAACSGPEPGPDPIPTPLGISFSGAAALAARDGSAGGGARQMAWLLQTWRAIVHVSSPLWLPLHAPTPRRPAPGVLHLLGARLLNRLQRRVATIHRLHPALGAPVFSLSPWGGLLPPHFLAPYSLSLSPPRKPHLVHPSPPLPPRRQNNRCLTASQPRRASPLKHTWGCNSPFTNCG